MVPEKELITVYTKSGEFIGNNNGIRISQRSYGDMSQFYLPALGFIHEYVSAHLPQNIAEMVT